MIKKCANIIDDISKTSSTNEKINIFKKTIGTDVEPTLKKVLIYTYHPDKVYKIGKTRLKNITNVQKDCKYKDIFHMLDVLNDATGITDELLNSVYVFLNNEKDIELRNLYIKMILKDMRAGFSVSTINKVWNNLIPVFKLQLARKYEDRADKIIGKEIAITPKLDGVRCALIIKDDKTIEMRTRQNKIIKGLNSIEDTIKNISPYTNVLLDGELVYNGDDVDSSAARYRKTVEIVNSDSKNKDNITFHIFDIVDLTEFYSEHCTWKYDYRRTLLKQLQEYIEDTEDISIVPVLYQGKDHSNVSYHLNKAIDKKLEGIMVNLVQEPYDCKRTNNLLKVKQMYTVDVLVVDIEEGEGKYRGLLGNIVVDYKDNKVRVGSGFSDEQRKIFWDKPELILDKIVEVQYFEESKNKVDEKVSLRFPIFQRIREDKTINDISFD